MFGSADRDASASSRSGECSPTTARCTSRLTNAVCAGDTSTSRSSGVAAGIHLGPNATVVAWPSAESGAMPVESGVALAYRREIEAAPDPERRRELEDEIAAAQSVFRRAEEFGVHDLIDPCETRPRLCDWIDQTEPQLALHTGPRSYTLRP
ncbi:MAG: hypothetical protein QF890_04395 [Myxococcota bacterium]|jgi:acetyl-CoA carboxylase carboxyltransferase component|nr:hypothetical protein [Deltaproteobacteria bacterium]MCP4240091.1 hypothetical protein [bacterium]MDP6076112.1 hypothetical protein [Myxococcota bacterium]MDP6244604.1 hypothetical protein [Myxococcota bacterium]MDP7073540.1 hypothetical protein [Myxococcota bacterium]